jgi:DNA-binding beta-propeller fold protein YncE
LPKSLSLVFFLLGALSFMTSSYAGYDDGARYAFTASASKHSIYIIDLHKRVLADTIVLEAAPGMISASDNLKALVVANSKAKELILLDLSGNQLARHNYPLGISPDYIKVSPLGETVAIYDREEQILEVHAIRRRQVLLHAEKVRSKDRFTFNLDGSNVYWIDHESGTLNSVDLWSKTKALQLADAGAGLSAVSRSTDGLLGFVSNSRDNKVYVINLRDFSKLTEIRVGSQPGRPWGTADGRYMMIPNQGDNTVTAISTSNLQNLYTVATVNNPISINPGWLDTTAAVIGEEGDLEFIDVEKGTTGQAYDLESIPHEGIVTSDSRTLAIPVPEKGKISFFDMRTRTLIAEISGLPSDISAATLAVSNNLCH